MKKIWYSKKDVCFLLSVAYATVDRWTHDENYAYLGFPKPEKIGFRVFWRATEVDDWAEAKFAKD